ncbi:MAG: FAD-dependent oxidoreductase [Oceanicaulis sp.]
MDAKTTVHQTPPPADVNVTLSEADLKALMAYGEVRRHEQGEVLVREGDRRVDNLITLSGQTHIFVEGQDGPTRLGWMERGQFAGDIGVLTGQASLARVTMGEAGEVLHIPFERFQRLLVENSGLSDIFVRTLSARRAFALSRADAPVLVIGSALDRSVFALRDFLTRHGAPHTWCDPVLDSVGARIVEAKQLSDDQLPAVLLGGERVLIRPTVNDLAAEMGSDLLPDGAAADVIIVGAGPAGLSASVYAGSEGLTVLTLDAAAPGGQAGTSSKIENYLGFPTGVSGRELAERAAVQAQKFGVRLAAPVRAARLSPLEDGAWCVETSDGRKLKGRAVIIATGAQYRKLDIEHLETFEGAGIYYGASPLEAQLCGGSEAIVVGAGNSAGQGAVFLAKTAKAVHVLYRRADIRETMSEYLVRRLEETDNIHLHPGAEIETLHPHCPDANAPRLAAVTLKTPGGPERLEATFVFLFIGAAPFTDWLPAELAKDAKGFLKTGGDLQPRDLVRAGWDLERMPSPFETSLKRVYAIGDVRSGSLKRVASSVGEGGVVVGDLHKALGEVTRT